MLCRPGPCTGEKKDSHGNALVFTKVQECADFPSCLEMLPRAGKVDTGVRACIWEAAGQFWVGVHTCPCPEKSGPAFCSFGWVATEMKLPLWPNLHLCKTALYSGIPRKQSYLPSPSASSLINLSPPSLHPSWYFLLRFLFPLFTLQELLKFSPESAVTLDFEFNQKNSLFLIKTFNFSPLQRNSPLQLKSRNCL